MIPRSKYLGQIMKEEGIEIVDNTLIISPCGSGKTHYILHELSADKKMLYLCDTSNLKEQVENDIEKMGICEIEVMTYSCFGRLVYLDSNDDVINQYDYIVCDEIHNLVDYENFTQDKYLSIALNKLLKRYEDTIIVMFTGTPYYLQQLMSRNFLVGVKLTTHDFSKNQEIKRYVNLQTQYINHIGQIQFQMDSYKDMFKYTDYKMMIYTQKLSDIRIIEEMCEVRGLKYISIWSKHNKEKLNDEQKKLKDKILTEGMLTDDVQVVIFNRAMESGINIIDDRVKVFICNTLNYTQQIQSRNRLRFDVNLVVVRTKNINKAPKIIIQEELLNNWYTKADIESLIIDKYNIRDKKNHRKMTVNKLGNWLTQFNYTIKSKRKTIDGKKLTIYMIVKIK